MNYLKLYSNQKKLEYDIEQEILTLLNKNYGKFWKVDYAGRLVKGKMWANKNPFVEKHMPDIEGIIKGQYYFFEVKRPGEHKQIIRNYEKYKIYEGKNKAINRYKGQILMGEELRANGGIGGFVSEFSHCVELMKCKDNL